MQLQSQTGKEVGRRWKAERLGFGQLLQSRLLPQRFCMTLATVRGKHSSCDCPIPWIRDDRRVARKRAFSGDLQFVDFTCVPAVVAFRRENGDLGDTSH